MGLTHFDEAATAPIEVGHLRSRWTNLGKAAGCEIAGVRRIEVADGHWSTPAHEHNAEDELFYVLAGRGLSWHAGEVSEIGAGDCIAYPAGRGAHSLHGIESLDVLAFGPNLSAESIAFPRLGISLVGTRAVASMPRAEDGLPIQFARESALGPSDLPDEPGERPATVANLADVESRVLERPRVANIRRSLGDAVGSRRAGLNHLTVAPRSLSAPLHCHSVEEEIFVVLEGRGTLLLDDDETQVRAGHVIVRPPATRVAHAFRAGDEPLTLLAYGTRDPADACWYPRSNKISFRGLGVIGRIEKLDYWDGED